MDVINRLEAAFDVKVPDSDLTPRKFETVAKMVAYFDARKNKKNITTEHTEGTEKFLLNR